VPTADAVYSEFEFADTELKLCAAKMFAVYAEVEYQMQGVSFAMAFNGSA
jgi:hypothetical protein